MERFKISGNPHEFMEALIEAARVKNPDGSYKYVVSLKVEDYPNILFGGHYMEAFLVEAVNDNTNTTPEEKLPTETEIIQQELIEQFGESQIGAASQETVFVEPKPRRGRPSK